MDASQKVDVAEKVPTAPKVVPLPRKGSVNAEKRVSSIFEESIVEGSSTDGEEEEELYKKTCGADE